MERSIDALVGVDLAAMSHDERLTYLEQVEVAKARLDACSVRGLAAVAADPPPIPTLGEARASEWVREEVACALRWSAGTTGARMHTAQTLVDRLPATLGELTLGRFSYLHASAVAESVVDLDEAITGKVEARVLGRAADQTVAELRRSLKRAVTKLNPREEAEQRHAEEELRRVCVTPQPHGMSTLWAYLPAEDAQTIWTVVQAVADAGKRRGRAGADDHRSADHRRADALSAICAAVLTGGTSTTGATGATGNGDVVVSHDHPTGPDGPEGSAGPVGLAGLVGLAAGLPLWQGRRPAVQVTVALSTLLGCDEQPGELDGYGPIPADVARRIAADPTGTWHRLVTDQLGHLIDYGRSVYEPPADLRDFVLAKHRTCRRPGCNRTARRCEIDHVIAWADGGPTNEANLDPKCPRDHHLKHDAGWTSVRLPDGTIRWTTPIGRSYDKPPETYPVDHTRPKINTGNPPDSDDPPPF